MKIRILIIATLLYSVSAVALPQNDNYNVISTTDSKAEIEVSGNCKITVADLNGALKIYGDQNYGGTTDKLFSSKQVEPNNNIKGIRISRENKKVVLIIDYNKLTNSEITLIKAEYKDSIKAKPNKPGYFPSSNVYKISFIKSGVNEAGSTPEIPTGS